MWIKIYHFHNLLRYGFTSLKEPKYFWKLLQKCVYEVKVIWLLGRICIFSRYPQYPINFLCNSSSSLILYYSYQPHIAHLPQSLKLLCCFVVFMQSILNRIHTVRVCLLLSPIYSVWSKDWLCINSEETLSKLYTTLLFTKINKQID